AARRGRGETESPGRQADPGVPGRQGPPGGRSEEHTSELQSLTNIVCRLLLEKKKIPRSIVVFASFRSMRLRNVVVSGGRQEVSKQQERAGLPLHAHAGLTPAHSSIRNMPLHR